jgi:indolepyruvate decarboxylase
VIDAALLYKRPVYIELPRDLTLAEVDPTLSTARPSPMGQDDATLAAAVADAVAQLHASVQPAVFVGLEAVRLELLDQVRELIERHALPTFVTPLSKSAISEQHPCFGGVYGGAMSRAEVRDFVESADCLFMIGSLMTDLDLGGETASLATEKTILVSRDRVRIAHRTYENVQLEDFLQALLQAELPDFSQVPKPPQVSPAAWSPQPGTAVTVARLFERLGAFLDETTIVIADPGDATFGALDLPVRESYEFLANAFYASLGFAVPASIGAQLARPDYRPLVLVGDGAFQMTGAELSTSLRYGLNPIVVILNNGGYLTERLLIDGAFNDVLPWRYAALPEVFGAGQSFMIETEEELEAALTTAGASQNLCILDVHLGPLDASPALHRLAEGLNAQALPVAASSS